MKNIEFYDWVGPLITAIAAIIALSGESFKKDVKWVKKLNWRGYSIAILIISSVIFSILNTNSTKAENKAKLKAEQIRFDSLKIHLEAVTKSKDSLFSITKKLDKDFVDATLNELREQRRIFDENKKRVLINLLNETVTNVITYNSWIAISKKRWINEGTPTVRFSNQNLKSALLIPIDPALVSGISVLIKSIDEINEGVKYIEFSESGSKDRETNVETVFYKLTNLGKNLDALYKELKKNLPGVNVQYKITDTTSVTW